MAQELVANPDPTRWPVAIDTNCSPLVLNGDERMSDSSVRAIVECFLHLPPLLNTLLDLPGRVCRDRGCLKCVLKAMAKNAFGGSATSVSYATIVEWLALESEWVRQRLEVETNAWSSFVGTERVLEALVEGLAADDKQ
jgi:hypothetical protein